MTNVLRFSFDIGTNSIGWAVFDAHTEAASLPLSAQSSVSLKSLGAAGVRIFSDGRNPKDGSSLAMMRREPRAAGRRRDRFLQRQRKLIALLIEYGLFPSAQGERKRLEKLNPYALRAKGLDHALTLHEFGRVLFHLNHRRGFWSNRVTDGADKETGVLKQAAKRLDETLKLDGVRTLGEFLNKREVKGLSTRFRITGSGKDADHEFYPTRGLIDAEFQTLWAMQSQYHPDRLTKTAKDAIHNAIFHQRPLKAVKPGRCTLNPDEERLPAALPSVQARTIYQTLNELRYGQGLSLTQRLDRTQRDALASALLKGKALTFSSIRRTLKLPANTRFSLEDTRKDIVGCGTAKRLARADAFDKEWHSISLARKDEIVCRLLTEVDEETLVAWLVAKTGLSAEKAHAVAGATLPDGYGRLGATANAAVLGELIGDVITYSAAVERTGYHHSDFRTDKTLDRLPYYGLALERHVAFGTGEPKDSDEKRYGRIANPTVHIGLNQLRRVVNKLVAVHGRPDDIILELARDLKLSKKQKDELQKKNNLDEAANTQRRSWKGFATDIFEVNRKGWRPIWEREEKGGKLVMRLHKGDLIEIDDKDGERQVRRVVQLEPSANRIRTVGHHDAGDLQKRHDDPDDPFRWDMGSIRLMQVATLD
jgi:CRISPR-associated endonuclease Csn1